MELGLTGRRAAVAAATGGLGLASAEALVAEGARVVICGRHQDRLDAAVARLNALAAGVNGASGTAGGPAAYGVVADVGHVQGATDFVTAARETLGGLDVLVTNAGGPPPGDFTGTDLAAYLPALELNLLSVVAMCKAAVPAMREQRWGRVVAITSISVRQPIGGLILSNTARAGATGFLRTLAREVARDGVTVNSLLPGSHGTDRLRSLHGADLSGVADGIPAGRVGEPAEFGSFVAFLCSEKAGFVTGTTIPVDGGAYAGLL